MVIQIGSDRKIFICHAADGAKDVYLAGDFNHWNPAATPMPRAKDGSFRTKVRLSPGEHQYKFVVDGHWVIDKKAERQVQNSFGTCNSVIKVV
jgi:1,4-alpha-glucan branching enzyme